MSTVNQIFPALYNREAPPSLSSTITTEGRKTISIAKGSHLVGSTLVIMESTQLINIGNPLVWDAAEYATAANRAGKNFYLYSTVSGLILSANATVPSGYTADTSRKIGGFHCLCLSVGAISGHTLTNFVTGDILPASIWDLNWRPVCSPAGMVYSPAADVWVDIYLQSGTALTTASVYGATITDTRDYWSHGDDLAARGKRMLLDMEFSQIAFGSPEATNIMGSADPVTTGAHVDTASRRIISNIGCEDCTGVMYQWIEGGHVYRNDDASYVGAGSWKTTGSRGQQYTQGGSGAVGLLASGDWETGSFCGSRCRIATRVRSTAAAFIGSRGCARVHEITANM